LKVGDLVKPLEELPLAYDWYHKDISVGVITEIVNGNMEPALIEVMWNDGARHRVYADDVDTIHGKRKKD